MVQLLLSENADTTLQNHVCKIYYYCYSYIIISSSINYLSENADVTLQNPRLFIIIYIVIFSYFVFIYVFKYY